MTKITRAHGGLLSSVDASDMPKQSLPQMPEGLELLTVKLVIRVDRPLTAVEHSGLHQDAVAAVDRALAQRDLLPWRSL